MKALFFCVCLAVLLLVGCADATVRAKGEWQGGISTEVKR